MTLTSAYGTWFYITGNAEGPNYPIYRTQAFKTFHLHMYAFDPSNKNGSNQWTTATTLNINGKLYLIFHNKPDYQRYYQGGQWHHTFAGRGTVFFKELTADPVTGHLTRLYETYGDPKRDVRQFRISVCRP